jgi:hypothetical protein
VSRSGIQVTGLDELTKHLEKQAAAVKQLERDLNQVSKASSPEEAKRRVEAAFRRAGLPVDKRILDEIDKAAAVSGK